MNPKRLGFLTGAAVAAAGVYAFYALTTVTDDDRLTDVLRDHCMPYVTAGTDPFVDMGRERGVFDGVEPLFEDAQTRILYDGRFVAHWGVAPTADGGPVRTCVIDPIVAEDQLGGFVVNADGFVGRYTDVIAAFEPLVLTQDTIVDDLEVFGWYGAERAENEGLRVVMIASPGLVSSLLVATDITD